ncbi:SusC/RagA family TonB-linked outer membrane protein [Pedobacter sp. HMF7647]|uniref:SusC/RagA family TonB-linked outer membrane protein n=1 Tax=Hufsiella arboris TaxID=2695275 RepID=A0A7K1YD15_9SPHI|nr:TonB-dependent receptor [Hufsiella arboris]MXV52476.1 SusC/RagA family TonB-linked outer membrane protein [Hufsiella arboris]
MKFTFSQLFLACIVTGVSYANNGKAQNVLNKVVNISVENGSLESTLKSLEKNKDIKFVYSKSVIKTGNTVSCEAVGEKLKNVLDKILIPNGINYEVMNERIVLSKNNLYTESITSLPLEEQQQANVRGQVTDGKGEPLAGVSVKLKGSNAGASTDIRGNYSISVPSGDGTLVFTYVGFVTQEVPLNNRTTLNVKMLESTQSLNEVVVIGYGTQKKSDLTGAIGSVKSTQLQERPASSLNEQLAGRVTGVQVNTNSGRPGGQTNVRIRGFSSINTSNNPLYVVDGVILPVGTQTQRSNAIDYINPSDIESVEVLKDASATAIYGARGANGVILVTTKRGSTSGGKVTYDNQFSTNIIGPNRVEMLDANQYIATENLAYDNIKVYDPQGWAAGNYSAVEDPREKRKRLPLLFDSNGNPLYNTDWMEEATQSKLSQNHQLSFTNGNDKSSYGIFAGYRDDNGLLKNTYMKRYSGRFTFDSQIKDWLKVGGDLSYNNQDENIGDTRTGALNSVRMITEAFPFLPVKYPNGAWADNVNYPGAEGGSNPVHILEESQYKLITQNTLGNIFTDIMFTKDLTMRTVLGANITSRENDEYFGRSLYSLSFDQRGTASVRSNRETYWSLENYLTYNKTFNEKHNVTGLLGISWQETNLFDFNANSQNFSTDYFQDNNLGAGSVQNPSGSDRSKFAFNSYFGRANYSFKNKYLITLTGRLDGSSKFGENHKYAFFPSAALAWRISDEEFLKGNKTISNLKLRTSYGATGNSEIPAYSALSLLGTNYAGIFNNSRVTGTGTSRLANPDLRWEKTTQYDAGLEVGFFNNRISLEGDIYYRKTTDMLLDVPLPRSSGYSVITQNVGSLENKGVEIALNTINIDSKDFTWKTTFNISMNRSKVLALATPAPIYSGNPNFLSNTGIIQEGEPLGSFYGLVRLGTWGTAEAAEAAKFASYRAGKPILPGDIKYLDVNGDYAINDADRVVIGNNTPKGYGSFLNSLRYKNVDFTLELQYSYGNDLLNQTRHSGEDRVSIANSFNTVLNAWTPENQNTPIAAIRDTRAGYVTNVDSHWVEDGSFLRGKNILLGYTFPTSITQKMHLSRLRLYASAQNFFLVTNFTGNDPEVTTYDQAFSQGQTFFDYPKPTTFMVGLNVGL